MQICPNQHKEKDFILIVSKFRPVWTKRTRDIAVQRCLSRRQTVLNLVALCILSVNSMRLTLLLCKLARLQAMQGEGLRLDRVKIWTNLDNKNSRYRSSKISLQASDNTNLDALCSLSAISTRLIPLFANLPGPQGPLPLMQREGCSAYRR